MPPATPLFAGSPTRASHSPEPSYMPHEAMTDITHRATGAPITLWPVSGLTPKLARVAAITAMSKAVTDAAHCRKYASVATSSLEPSTP